MAQTVEANPPNKVETVRLLPGQLRTFRSACTQDQFLTDLTDHLENQLVAAGLVLTIQAELLART